VLSSPVWLQEFTSEDQVPTAHQRTKVGSVQTPRVVIHLIPPEPPACGSAELAGDVDGDGCPEKCCTVSCPTDFVVSDYDGDGCGSGCADKPCEQSSDCALYRCSFNAGQCDEPKGICSDNACDNTGPVCGCDGETYESG
jgi:hypothetical protein